MSISTIPLARIIYDDTNPDGWITRLLSQNNKLAGKIAFIANLDQTIQDLQPGQIWTILPIERHENYWKIQLIARHTS